MFWLILVIPRDRSLVLFWKTEMKLLRLCFFFNFSCGLIGRKQRVSPRTWNTHFQLNTKLFLELSVGNSIELTKDVELLPSPVSMVMAAALIRFMWQRKEAEDRVIFHHSSSQGPL